MGGCLRALRYAMGHPLAYRMDANDYTVITAREAKTLVRIGVLLMLMGQSFYAGLWMRR